MVGKKQYAIIGAGISGLSAAFWLQKKEFDITEDVLREIIKQDELSSPVSR